MAKSERLIPPSLREQVSAQMTPGDYACWILSTHAKLFCFTHRDVYPVTAYVRDGWFKLRCGCSRKQRTPGRSLKQRVVNIVKLRQWLAE